MFFVPAIVVAGDKDKNSESTDDGIECYYI